MLTIDSLVKSFTGNQSNPDRVRAIDSIDLEVKQGDLFTLLGPSGCGKTTTLRSIAGLERPDSGAIFVDDRTFFNSERRINVPANQRGLGMVFQSYAIWPHMNVFKNVAFPLTVRSGKNSVSRKEIERRVERVLAVVRLEQLRDRQATDLSGGQQQRLALARALVMEPPLLLLDEPLSNLDAKLREEMRFELKRLQRQMNITTIYVTHDQVEALAMSTSIAVMNEGKIEQIGAPQEVYRNPSSHFVASFIGTANFFHGTIDGQVGVGSYRVVGPFGSLVAASGASLASGEPVTVSIRPEDVELTVMPDHAEGDWRGEVVNKAFLGDAVEYLVKVADAEVRARCHPTVSLLPGDSVEVVVRAEASTLIPAAEVTSRHR